MRQGRKHALLAWLLCGCMLVQLVPQALAVMPQKDEGMQGALLQPIEQTADSNLQQAETETLTEDTTDTQAPSLREETLVFGMQAFQLPLETVDCAFTDVAAESWYYNAVAYCSTLGLVNGKTEERFDPDANISTAESITLAVQVYRRYHGITTDIVPEATGLWYTPYENLARAYGILPEGIEISDAPIRREQAAAVFYYMLPDAELPAINQIAELPDVGQNNPYFTEILALYNAGVLAGTDAVYGTFEPSRSIARCEFVQLLLSLILPEKRTLHTLTPYTGMAAFDMSRYDVRCTFSDVTQADWFYHDVAVQQTIGLISGVDATHFAPNGQVTLAQALSVAVRTYQKYHGVSESYLAADGEAWYMGFVRLA